MIDIKGNIRYGLRRVKNFFKWGWRLRNVHPWDYSYLYEMMYWQFSDMQRDFENDNRHAKSVRKSVREMIICKNLCRRLSDEVIYYEDDDLIMFPDPVYKRHTIRQEYDRFMLFHLMNRRIHHWWS